MDKHVKASYDSENNKVQFNDIDGKQRERSTSFEVIVVVLIVIILAVIFVPIVIQFVEDSKLQQANASAKTIYNAATPVEAGLGDVKIDAKDYKTLSKWTSVKDETNTFLLAMYKYMDKDKLSGYFKFNFKDGYVSGVDFISENNTKYMGSAPVKNEKALAEEINIEAQNIWINEIKK